MHTHKGKHHSTLHLAHTLHLYLCMRGLENIHSSGHHSIIMMHGLEANDIIIEHCNKAKSCQGNQSYSAKDVWILAVSTHEDIGGATESYEGLNEL